ncbi:MAG: NAD(P)H-hydrate dehydratase [Chitinophagales bacterium]|nr:NAD(P)H-hydrate dehydratase [Chitinophagales bacterium]
MKIFSAQQIRDWDQYTITHEPISSIDLMERAAQSCTEWLLRRYPDIELFHIYCGKGNNGGDGLAIARLLLEKGYIVNLYILEFGHRGTDDFQQNLARLHLYPQGRISFIQSADHIQVPAPGEIAVDALFGSGLNRELDGLSAALVSALNQSGAEIISIDIPSGLFSDSSSKGKLSIQARYTLSFQTCKLALLLPENQGSFGKVEILDIGLHGTYEAETNCRFELPDDQLIHAVLKTRSRFAHKGNFGHAMLLAGSRGKAGAAVLSAGACLRSGAGLLTVHLPAAACDIVQTAVPEAMVETDSHADFISQVNITDRYSAVGIGPGIGQAPETVRCFEALLNQYKRPMVIDADALNILAAAPLLLKLIPAGSILTPHPKEFERLAGPVGNDPERIEKLMQLAKEWKSVIVLKGHHSLIATPGGKGYFNSTGNPGMATAGSGDVLTGILTGLLAQGYSPVEAALLGVYLHGLAGDIAAKEISEEALIAGDIVEYLGKAFLEIS